MTYVLIGACVVFFSVVTLLRARDRPAPPSSWKVAIVPSQKYNADYSGSYRLTPVRGEVAVRIASGKEFLTIGCVEMEADDFEDRLNTLVADAENKAAAINAAEAVTA